jgi:glyoxylase-like metal-dependent hydrolase (beta-lactamase superfamily II)
VFSGHIDGVGKYQIDRLDLGELTVPAGTPLGGCSLPVNAFLVSHPQGRVLFDTGLGAAYPGFDRLLSPIVRRTLEEALAEVGFAAADITGVINCHLHYDHCGGNPLFPGIPIYIQVREYEARDQLNYYIAGRIEYPKANVQLLRGEEEILPGVRALPTPGHTPGHQSIVIADTEGAVILAGQAAYTVAEFLDPEAEPARGFRTAWDGQEFLRSVERLRALRPRRVYFSHDAGHWEPETIAGV